MQPNTHNSDLRCMISVILKFQSSFTRWDFVSHLSQILCSTE